MLGDMAEPTNTPFPPSTPVPGATPRSASPVPPPPAPPVSAAAPAATNGLTAPSRGKPVVLHIGDPVRYNPATYEAFARQFDVVRPSTPERRRPEFAAALRDGRWGPFSAIFRPFWGSGGEMGRWDRELIALLPASCRVFASAGAGFDWADTKALGEKGIIYCNSGLAAAEAVADFSVAMVISTFRHLPWCMGGAAAPAPPAAAASEGEARLLFTACHTLATSVSHNLRGHALGLIGLGNIGQQIAAKLGCPAFGMEIHYFDVVRKSAAIERELGATFHDTLEDLMRTSDCVVLCTPASADGRPLITGDVLAAAKRGARFVNIARGSLVDEDALVAALADGTLSSAALDVHAAEPEIHPGLLELAGIVPPKTGGTPGRVMLTCHNAGGTVETHVGFEELSMQNIMAVLGGGKAITPVNLHHMTG